MSVVFWYTQDMFPSFAAFRVTPRDGGRSWLNWLICKVERQKLSDSLKSGTDLSRHSRRSLHPSLSILEDPKDKSRFADINIARTVQITPDACEFSPVTEPQLEASHTKLAAYILVCRSSRYGRGMTRWIGCRYCLFIPFSFFISRRL